jgi:outer membrane protein TolC
MFRQIKVLSYPVLLTMVMASGSVLGDSFGDPSMSRERIYSDAAAEAARQGQQFYNDGSADQLHHRVYEQSPDFAYQSQNQHQYREQQDKQAKHQYQYREKSSGQHMHQSGFSGGGSGGKGGGRGR